MFTWKIASNDLANKLSKFPRRLAMESPIAIDDLGKLQGELKNYRKILTAQTEPQQARIFNVTKVSKLNIDEIAKQNEKISTYKQALTQQKTIISHLEQICASLDTYPAHLEDLVALSSEVKNAHKDKAYRAWTIELQQDIDDANHAVSISDLLTYLKAADDSSKSPKERRSALATYNTIYENMYLSDRYLHKTLVTVITNKLGSIAKAIKSNIRRDEQKISQDFLSSLKYSPLKQLKDAMAMIPKLSLGQKAEKSLVASLQRLMDPQEENAAKNYLKDIDDNSTYETLRLKLQGIDALPISQKHKTHLIQVLSNKMLELSASLEKREREVLKSVKGKIRVSTEPEVKAKSNGPIEGFKAQFVDLLQIQREEKVSLEKISVDERIKEMKESIRQNLNDFYGYLFAEEAIETHLQKMFEELLTEKEIRAYVHSKAEKIKKQLDEKINDPNVDLDTLSNIIKARYNNKWIDKKTAQHYLALIAKKQETTVSGKVKKAMGSISQYFNS